MNKEIEKKKQILLKVALLISPILFIFSIKVLQSIGYFIFLEACFISVAREIIMRDFLDVRTARDRIKFRLLLLALMTLGVIIIFLEWQSKGRL